MQSLSIIVPIIGETVSDNGICYLRIRPAKFKTDLIDKAHEILLKIEKAKKVLLIKKDFLGFEANI